MASENRGRILRGSRKGLCPEGVRCFESLLHCRITGYPGLEGTPKDSEVQLFNEWLPQGLNLNLGIISTLS